MSSFVTLDSLIGGALCTVVQAWLPGYVQPQRLLVPASSGTAFVLVPGGDPTDDGDQVTVYGASDGSGPPVAQPLDADVDGSFTGWVAQPQALDLVVQGSNLDQKRISIGVSAGGAGITEVRVVASDAAMLAIVGVQEGWVAVRTDLENAAFMHNGGVAGTDADWTQIGFIDVVSVNGHMGVVVLSHADVGALAAGTTLDEIPAAAAVALSNFKITGAGDATNPQDLVNLRTADGRYATPVAVSTAEAAAIAAAEAASDAAGTAATAAAAAQAAAEAASDPLGTAVADAAAARGQAIAIGLVL